MTLRCKPKVVFGLLIKTLYGCFDPWLKQIYNLLTFQCRFWVLKTIYLKIHALYVLKVSIIYDSTQNNKTRKCNWAPHRSQGRGTYYGANVIFGFVFFDFNIINVLSLVFETNMTSEIKLLKDNSFKHQSVSHILPYIRKGWWFTNIYFPTFKIWRMIVHCLGW